MTKRVEIRNWLFKGLATDDVLDELESEGIAVRPEHDPGAVQRVLSLEDFPARVRRDAMQAFPAYLAFFCLENAVRQLVMERLSENHGSDWWEKCTSKSIRDQVSSRQEKEGKNRWHTRRGEHEIHYTNFGDLKDILISNWEDFDELFPDQNWISSRLDELESSRNIIAHSNVLDDRELERIELYLDDWIRQVG